VGQLCVAHAVVRAPCFSSLLTLKIELERVFRDRNSFVLPKHLCSICFGFTSVVAGFSLMFYLMYGLSKMTLPHHRVSLSPTASTLCVTEYASCVWMICGVTLL